MVCLQQNRTDPVRREIRHTQAVGAMVIRTTTSIRIIHLAAAPIKPTNNMEYQDLENNEDVSVEQRLKHLEREAGYVRDFSTMQMRINIAIVAVNSILMVLILMLAFKK